MSPPRGDNRRYQYPLKWTCLRAVGIFRVEISQATVHNSRRLTNGLRDVTLVVSVKAAARIISERLDPAADHQIVDRTIRELAAR